MKHLSLDINPKLEGTSITGDHRTEQLTSLTFA